MIFSFLRFIIFFILVLATSILVYSFPNNVTDQQALFSIKSSITADPMGVLSSWNNSIHFCRWKGVTCSRRRQRVTSLNLSSQHLVGTLSSHIGNLSFLRVLYLYENNFHGSIPNEIGRLFRLRILNLIFNSFQGEFPSNLSHCVDIRNISMYGNNLEGKLPTEFSSWPKLYRFDIEDNNFTGSIPPSIGNISSLGILYLGGNNLRGGIPNEIGRLLRLQSLYLDHNSFQGVFPANLTQFVDIKNISMYDNDLEGKLPTEFVSWSKLYMFVLGKNHFTGSIPPSLGNTSSLRYLYLDDNNLTGNIPLEVANLDKLEFLDLSINSLLGMVPLPLYNISSLYLVGLTQNELEGTLPVNLGFTLPKLQGFYAALNRFLGPLPPSITNASNLVIFDISYNNITGPIPNNLGSLPNLRRLHLSSNPLGENQQPDDLSFFNSLVNCTHLTTLSLHNNGLTGEIPNSIINLSTTLEIMDLHGNHIHGSIPREIGKLVNVTLLDLSDKLLTGTIPESIGELSKLNGLYLRKNNISGVIPTSIANITHLIILHLDDNMLQGSIPTALFNIPALQQLSLANNRLGGTLPFNIGTLQQLVQLDVSYNKLTGDIPVTLGGCVMLEELHMEGNLFHGRIPSSFKALKSLRILDLSSNNISENIPNFFDGFHLIEFLNLSHNKLEGEVPREGLFSNISVFSVIGNMRLCGGVQALHLPVCPKKKETFSLRIILLLVLVPLGILLACLFLICYRRRNFEQLNDMVPVVQHNQYLKLRYQDLLLATNKFSPNNLLGEGRYGSVYKGVLESVKHIVAVKVLNVGVRGANKTFLAECETLRNIRHRNLIKIITACSSTDSKGNDFKALVFEFMTNGSVDNWLHPSPYYQGNKKNLTLLQRLNIFIDVALGVDYLHHHSHASIIHCDIKPSNILLDEDFVAHIGDFGLARFSFATTSDINQPQMSSTGVRGTVGYVPPEYGMCGEISVEGDVYSYGILLLEMFSGKRPTESSIIMESGNNLHDYVRKALPQRVMDIADPRIIVDQEECGLAVNQSYSRAAMEVCLASVFEVGILCSEETPKKRINISVAIKQLHVARDKFLQSMQ